MSLFSGAAKNLSTRRTKINACRDSGLASGHPRYDTPSMTRQAMPVPCHASSTCLALPCLALPLALGLCSPRFGHGKYLVIVRVVTQALVSHSNLETPLQSRRFSHQALYHTLGMFWPGMLQGMRSRNC